MEELKALVKAAQTGDLDAFGKLVQRFQDMAYGYGLSLLGDFHLAQDAAQEAFIDAFRYLPDLLSMYSLIVEPRYPESNPINTILSD